MSSSLSDQNIAYVVVNKFSALNNFLIENIYEKEQRFLSGSL